MEITIQCGCGNKVIVQDQKEKYTQRTQFRDNLYKANFCVVQESTKEIYIECGECRRRMVLEID